MFHILIDPSGEFGSGLLRDGDGKPIEFATEGDATNWLSQGPFDKAKIVSVDKPIDLNNPGGIPQVGSASNPIAPGVQVHPASLDFDKVLDVKPVIVNAAGIPESIKKAQERDAEGKARLAGDANPQAVSVDQKTDEQVKAEDAAKVEGAAHNAG